MPYEVIIADVAQKRLDKYLRGQSKSQRDFALDVISSLSLNPRAGIGRKHPLKGNLRGHWSCSVGPAARLIYHIDDGVLVVTATMFSKDHYKDVSK